MKASAKLLVVLALMVGHSVSALSAAKPPASDQESPKRIAVLAASLSLSPAGKAWPSLLDELFQDYGYNAEVLTTGAGGIAFSSALTESCYGTKSPARRTVDVNPDVILIELGLGDAYLMGKTSSQIVADAIALRDYLTSNLPNATLIYISNPAHDQVNYPTAGPGVKRKGLIPFIGLLDLTTTTNERAVLDNLVPTSIWTAMGEWIAADAALRTVFDGFIQTDYWKIARAGGLSADILHLTEFGEFLMFKQIYMEIINCSEIKQAIPVLNDAYDFAGSIDFSSFWESLFTRSGDDWIVRTGDWYGSLTSPNAAYEIVAVFADFLRATYFWTNRQKPDWSISGNYPGSGELFLDIRNLFPKQSMSVKLWPSTSAEPVWTSAGTATSSGTFLYQLGTYFPLGTYHLKVKAGNDIFELDDVVF